MTQTMNTDSPYLSRIRIAGWATAALLLLTPLIAMRFTDEVNWTGSDFVFAAVLLGSVGLGFEFVVRKTTGSAGRWAGVVAIVGAFLLVWINGAVGIIGGEDNLGNLLYGVVLAVGLLGALASRFRVAGMMRTLTAMALVQVVVPVAAWVFGWSEAQAAFSPETLGVTAMFVTLWLASAILFRNAAQDESGVPAA